MKRVYFGQSDLEFMFESKEEINEILSGKIVEAYIDPDKSKKVIFGSDFESEDDNSFSLSDYFGKSRDSYLSFSKSTLQDFSKGNCNRMRVILGNLDVGVYNFNNEYNNPY